MSGYKHAMVSISEEEYHRLHDMAMKKKFKESKKRAREVDDLRNMNEQLLQMLREQERDFDGCLVTLGNEIGRLELETQQEMHANQEEMFQDVLSKVGSLWEENTNTLAILEDLDQRLRDQNSRRDAHMRKTDTFLRNLTSDNRTKNEMAASWLASASSMTSYICNQYDQERFAPGRFEQIVQEINLAQTNLSNGLPEAALMGSQQAYLHLSGMRLELEETTQAWNLLHRVTLQAARDLFDLVRENSTCRALDLEGNELPFTLQMNYWSRGTYAEQLGQIKSIILTLRDGSGEWSMDDLRTCLQDGLPRIKKEFDSLLFAARLSAINSQIRINIADLSLEALEGQGFTMEEGGYSQGDRRNPFIINLKNIEGSRVTIQVDPLEESENANDLTIISRDKDQRTEHELRQRSNEIIRALLQRGLRVGPVQETPQHVSIPRGGRNAEKTETPLTVNREEEIHAGAD
jgi:hypothetical protein